MMSAMYGNIIAQNTVVEKQTRIVEILLAGMPAKALMIGKVLGISAVAIGQTALMAVVALVGSRSSTVNGLLSTMGASVITYLAFFAIGFILLAAIYAGTAALASRAEDVSYAVMPAVMLVMLPYALCMSLGFLETPRLVLSFIPFSAPIAMPVRLLLEPVPWWQPVLAFALLLATAVALLLVASKLYERSILRTGARVKLSQAFKKTT
jgi:ABC-2 type transport system permease protein